MKIPSNAKLLGINHPTEFCGHRFSPDGRILMAINTAGLLYLWSAPSWEEIAAAEAKEKAGGKQP